MSDLDDKIYELRFYNVEHGRDADIRSRVQNDLAWLFPKHGIRPIGCWSAISASTLPMLVYITPWRNMIERSRHWASFYTDPDWQEVRNRTNAGSELVEDYEILFLRGFSEWNELPTQPGQVDEVILQRTLVGKGAAVATALAESEGPALERAGAGVMGNFDILSGGTLPSIVSFLRWNDWSSKRAAEHSLETDQALQASRAAERELYGAPLLGHRTSYLLEPVEVEWQ